MAWLVRGEDVLCPAEVASTAGARRRGLLGRGAVAAAMVLPRCRSVHTVGMRFPIDVAFLDGHGRVVDVVAPMAPMRVGRVRLRARATIEVPAGALDRWGVVVGDVLEIRSTDAQ